MELTCEFITKGHQEIMNGDVPVGFAERVDGEWEIHVGIDGKLFNTKSYCGLTDALEKLNFRVAHPKLTNEGLKSMLDTTMRAKLAANMRRVELTRKIDEEIDDLDRNIGHLKRELIDITWPRINLEISGQPCEESVLGVCVYDAMEDPSWNSCLACDNPKKRSHK